MVPPKDCFDVVILGGGPAGCAAGLTLLKRDGVSVAIVEASDYTVPRIGESLTPGIRPLLEYLDLWCDFEQQQSLESFGSEAAWGSPEPQSLDYMFTLHGTGWSLDRVRFDRMLADAFQTRGGTLMIKTQFVRADAGPEDEWDIQVEPVSSGQTESPARSLRAKFVIDATGRSGRLVRKLKGRRTIYDRLTGVACIGDLTDGTQLKHVTQVEACEYGWWYTAPVPGNRVSAVLMSDADIVSRKQAGQADAWQSLLNDMPLTRERVRGVSFSSEPRVFSAVSSCLEQVGGATWTAVGDAAASHDPLSSTGIPHAIGSGVHGGLTAASVLYADGRMMEAYQQSIQNDFQQYLQTHWRYYQKENRWPESLFWKRRRTPVSLDAEAELAGVHAMTDIPAYDPVHLSYAQQTELLGHCRPGRRAHEVVRAFTHQHPEVSDQQIILGLQELVGNGQVDLMSALQSVDKP